MDTRNFTLLTDFYELTMMQGYFRNNVTERVVFDLFYRQNRDDGGYAVCAGLANVIDYIKSLHFDYDDIDYLRGLNTFDEDFLDYLASFHFTGDVYAIHSERLRDIWKSSVSVRFFILIIIADIGKKRKGQYR